MIIPFQPPFPNSSDDLLLIRNINNEDFTNVLPEKKNYLFQKIITKTIPYSCSFPPSLNVNLRAKTKNAFQKSTPNLTLTLINIEALSDNAGIGSSELLRTKKKSVYVHKVLVRIVH